VPTPSALSRTISARQTCLCGTLRSRASTLYGNSEAAVRSHVFLVASYIEESICWPRLSRYAATGP
jgi:hypothetical protein